MTIDSHASDSEGASLSEEALALYWYFYDHRSPRGISRTTRSYAQEHFGWGWQKAKALMDEIEDAGYWKLTANGSPFFNSQTPPRPEPVWIEEIELVSSRPPARRPLAHRPGAGRALGELLTTKETPHSRNPFGVTTGDAAPSPTNTPAWCNVKSRRVVIDLVDYFAYKVRKQFHGLSPHPLNEKVVGAEIRHWVRRDGIDPGLVKTMIDIFASQELRGDIPAWKSFLAQRQKLLTMAQERARKQTVSDHWKQRRIEEAGT